MKKFIFLVFMVLAGASWSCSLCFSPAAVGISVKEKCCAGCLCEVCQLPENHPYLQNPYLKRTVK